MVGRPQAVENDHTIDSSRRRGWKLWRSGRGQSDPREVTGSVDIGSEFLLAGEDGGRSERRRRHGVVDGASPACTVTGNGGGGDGTAVAVNRSSVTEEGARRREAAGWIQWRPDGRRKVGVGTVRGTGSGVRRRRMKMPTVGGRIGVANGGDGGGLTERGAREGRLGFGRWRL